MTKFKTLLLLTMSGFFLSATAAYARQAVLRTQNESVKINRTTHAQHVLADVVAARIRAGLRGEAYVVAQDCATDDCVITIHR